MALFPPLFFGWSSFPTPTPVSGCEEQVSNQRMSRQKCKRNLERLLTVAACLPSPPPPVLSAGVGEGSTYTWSPFFSSAASSPAWLAWFPATAISTKLLSPHPWFRNLSLCVWGWKMYEQESVVATSHTETSMSHPDPPKEDCLPNFPHTHYFMT